MRFKSILATVPVFILLISPAMASDPGDLRDRAERFFRGVYGGDTSVVDELASEDIVISYSIFKTLYAKSAIAGRDSVKKFIAGFNSKWTDTKVTIDDVVVGGDKVVLVWSFEASPASATRTGGAVPVRRWGGISLFRFDADGKIEQEIGEESAPGPFGRLKSAASQARRSEAFGN